MPRAPSPRRYAQAVFQIARETGELDSWQEDLRVLSVAMENRELSGFLDAPQVPTAAKIEAIKGAVGDSVSPLALNLVSLLASRTLAGLMAGITEEYGRMLDAHRGIERAEVLAAVPLDDAQRRRVAEILEGVVGNSVRLTAYVEPNILGGLVARVSDRVIDGSLKTRLAEMRRNIVERA